jgi:hypothetical protein
MNPKVKQEKLDMVRRLYDQGWSLYQIGAMFDCSHEWIRNMLKRTGALRPAGWNLTKEYREKVKAAEITRRIDLAAVEADNVGKAG